MPVVAGSILEVFLEYNPDWVAVEGMWPSAVTLGNWLVVAEGRPTLLAVVSILWAVARILRVVVSIQQVVVGILRVVVRILWVVVKILRVVERILKAVVNMLWSQIGYILVVGKEHTVPGNMCQCTLGSGVEAQPALLWYMQ